MFERPVRPEGRDMEIAALAGKVRILSLLVACLRIRHVKCHCDGAHPQTDGKRGEPSAIVKFAACNDLANAMPDIRQQCDTTTMRQFGAEK